MWKIYKRGNIYRIGTGYGEWYGANGVPFESVSLLLAKDELVLANSKWEEVE